MILLACTWLILVLAVPTELSLEFFNGMTLMQCMILFSGAVVALVIVIAVLEAINAVLWYRKAAFGWDHFGFTLVMVASL